MFEVSILSAFLAGILSFISPCVLPLVPVYLGIMSRNAIYKGERMKISDRLYAFINSLLFVLGFSIVFIALGSTAAFLGQFLKNYLSIIGRVGGAVLIVFGLHYVGLFKISFLNIEKRLNMPEKLKTGYLWSFIFGVIFSFGWVPCVGMILSAILLLASRMETFAQGIFLLVIYSAGLGLPFILASIFISFFSNLLKRINRHLNIISIISGVFLIALGIIFAADAMFKIMGFLTSKIPFLSKFNF
ncbi:MAG: cytochrome c biogenesis protein CcdA [Actinobacteria bacterium]|nr:cytochrome c biogenesis protein CcdA [Actinomycetota bacterium]